MANQTLQNKLAEIKFRKQTAKQQTQKVEIFKNEPTLSEFKKIILPKLKETQKIFNQLKKRGIAISPYLEVGSEHCLRPMILENKFNAHGFATDISLYSLKNAKKYAKIFNFEKLPKTICADAYNLPFRKNSFPFVFIYETLHHFPNPKPLVSEVYRVLAPGGVLLIGADPIKQQFQIPLWRRPNKLRLWEKLTKAVFILPFISEIGKTETEYGIIETAFTPKVWQDALSKFHKIEAIIEVFPFGTVQKVNSDKLYFSPITKVGLFLFGGGIRAICFKEGQLKKPFSPKLICPNCQDQKKEIVLTSNTCSNCKAKYKKVENVLTILKPQILKAVINIK